jgi:putative NADH-flavin reductase
MGASRGIGLETVKQALEAGHAVRAMARSASSIAIRHANLETVSGDALDPSAVRRALEGMDAVIQALGVAAGPDMVFKPVRLFSEATRILVPAMEEMGVKRRICLTGFGAGDSRNRGKIFYNIALNVFLGRAYDDKDVQEQMIRKSMLDWMIARPGILTNGSRTSSYRVLVVPKDWRCGFISSADVADFLVQQIDDDEFPGKTPVLIS